MPNLDTLLFSEAFEEIGKINPQSTNTAVNSGYLSAAMHRRFVAIIEVGAMTATGTLDAKLQMAKDGSGTGVIDIPDKAIAQMLAASDSNKTRLIELRSDEIPDGYTHIRLLVTAATAASLVSARVWGYVARYEPVTQPATVAATH